MKTFDQWRTEEGIKTVMMPPSMFFETLVRYMEAEVKRIEGDLDKAVDVRVLAKSYLDRRDEDFTWVDPEDIKRLAKAVLKK